MRRFRDIKIIGIDHGYGNIKTATTVTPTGITAYTSEPTFGGNILRYDGMYYRIGEGHKSFLADKSSDNDFYMFTLMAIAKELDSEGIYEAQIHIAAGLPLTWVRGQKAAFSEYLMRNKNVEFEYEKHKFSVELIGSSIYPQGYCAVVDSLPYLVGVNMLADIGNGTMNIMFINNKRAIESKCYTEKLGVEQCVILAKNAVMDSFNVKIDEDIIQEVLCTGTADIPQKYLDCITAAARQYCGDVLNALRRYEYDPDLMRLYVTGGGAVVMENFGELPNDRVTFVEDICANAKGYEYLAERELFRKAHSV